MLPTTPPDSAPGSRLPTEALFPCPLQPIARHPDPTWEGTTIPPFGDDRRAYDSQPHSAQAFFALPGTGVSTFPPNLCTLQAGDPVFAIKAHHLQSTDTPHPYSLEPHQPDGVDPFFPSSSSDAFTTIESEPPFSAPPQGEAWSNGEKLPPRPIHDHDMDEDGPVRKKRAQVRIACTNCQKACKKCSSTRPCERCVKFGMKECVDSSRRPRKTGVKRGPYKRRSSKYGPPAQLRPDLFAHPHPHPPSPRSPSPSALPPGPRSAVLQSAFSAALSGPRWAHGQRLPPSSPQPLARLQAQTASSDGTGAGVLLPRTPTSIFPMSLGVGGRDDPFSRAVSPIHGATEASASVPEHFGQQTTPRGSGLSGVTLDLEFGMGPEGEEYPLYQHQQQYSSESTAAGQMAFATPNPFSAPPNTTIFPPQLRPQYSAPPSPQTQPSHWRTPLSFGVGGYPHDQQHFAIAPRNLHLGSLRHSNQYAAHQAHLNSHPDPLQQRQPPHPSAQIPSPEDANPPPDRVSPEIKALKRIRRPSILTLVGPGSRPTSPVSGPGSGPGPGLNPGFDLSEHLSGKLSGTATDLGMSRYGGNSFQGRTGVAGGPVGGGAVGVVVEGGDGRGRGGGEGGVRAPGTDSPTLFDQPMALDDVEMDWAGQAGDAGAGGGESGTGSGDGVGTAAGPLGQMLAHGGHGGLGQDISAWRRGSMDVSGSGLGFGFDGMMPFQS